MFYFLAKQREWCDSRMVLALDYQGSMGSMRMGRLVVGDMMAV